LNGASVISSPHKRPVARSESKGLLKLGHGVSLRWKRYKNDKTCVLVQRSGADDTHRGELREVQKDGLFGLVMIAAFRVAMGRMAGWQSEEPWFTGGPGASYNGLVQIARRLFACSPESTSNRVKNVLRAFPTQPQLLTNNAFSFEILGALTPLLFPFLVGQCRTEPWESSSGKTIRSRVVIERCRFLESSRCKGMCVGLCKIPTEEYFTRELGIPLSMTPNFETGGCELVWGKSPSDIENFSDLTCYNDCHEARRSSKVAAGVLGNCQAGKGDVCTLLRPWTENRDYLPY